MELMCCIPTMPLLQTPLNQGRRQAHIKQRVALTTSWGVNVTQYEYNTQHAVYQLMAMWLAAVDGTAASSVAVSLAGLAGSV
jgi:hypothetical protein